MTLVVDVRHGIALRYADWQCMVGSEGTVAHCPLLLVSWWSWCIQLQERLLLMSLPPYVLAVSPPLASLPNLCVALLCTLMIAPPSLPAEMLATADYVLQATAVAIIHACKAPAVVLKCAKLSATLLSLDRLDLRYTFARVHFGELAFEH